MENFMWLKGLSDGSTVSVDFWSVSDFTADG